MVALATAVSSRIELITMLESVDLRAYENEVMYRAMGIDRDPRGPEAATLIAARVASRRYAARSRVSSVVGRASSRSVWKLGEHTTPDWSVEHGDIIEVEETPSFRVRLEPGERWSGSTSTALPLVIAIPLVCAASPGIVNLGELPFVRGACALR